MSELNVRPFEQEDLSRVIEIALAAWEPIFAFYRHTMGEELFMAAHPDWRADKAGQVRRGCINSEAATALVAEWEGQVVGFITFYKRSEGIGEIGNNAVHPDFQGRGIGPHMYQAAFDQLKAEGMRFVRVTTGGDASHAPARRAYQKAGFTIQLPMVEYFHEL